LQCAIFPLENSSFHLRQLFEVKNYYLVEELTCHTLALQPNCVTVELHRLIIANASVAGKTGNTSMKASIG